MIIDTDRFKSVNDSYVHHVGDQVFEAVAGRIRSGLSCSDRLARHGGEEFAVVLPASGRQAAGEAAERLRVLVGSQFIDTHAGPMRITISMGVAVRVSAQASRTELLQRPDAGLLEATQQGRNWVVVVQTRANVA